MEFEKEMFLCARFTEYALRFDMMPAKLLNIPMEVLKISE